MRKLTDKKNFGELKIISDIPSAKKIKQNFIQKKINLANYSDAKIKEIQRFLDDTLEIKSSHNFLIYFMLLAVKASHQDTKVNIFKLSDAFKEIRKVEQTYAIKSILEKHDEFLDNYKKEHGINDENMNGEMYMRLRQVKQSLYGVTVSHKDGQFKIILPWRCPNSNKTRVFKIYSDLFFLRIIIIF